MAVRLAWGVVAERDRRAWLLDDGEPVDPWDRELPEGAAVVVGPLDADIERVNAARAELKSLIAVGGVVIAGAGVDLGEGMVSARLAGATGDRRDAVMATLRTLGSGERLGDRAATLVALFGVTATKPVGAAAESAISANCWAAVHLASAAADVLGPEQLERVLALRAPEGVDPIPSGAPSALAANLRQVLESHSRPRRLDLILDLWERVCARQTTLRNQERLLASQNMSVLEALHERYRCHDDDLATTQLRHWLEWPLTVTAMARFTPTWSDFWRSSVKKVFQDAIAATVLLRTATAVNEYGVIAGVEQMRAQIAAAAAMVTLHDVQLARRSTDRGISLPARPIAHIRELDARIRNQRPRDAGFERTIRHLLTLALPYATVVHRACHQLLCKDLPIDQLPERWDFKALHDWRGVAGYTEVRSPTDWHQNPLAQPDTAQSLAARIVADPTAAEDASDLLWYADLADAMVRIRGHRAAEIRHTFMIHFETNPPLPEPDPLTPRSDSIPLAVAGAAQLLSLGAVAPAKCRGWTELCAALMASGAIAAALTSEFEVPERVFAEDGRVLPGTTARIEIARTARRLAEWSDYMGNCIAGSFYQNEARAGRSLLVALRDADGTLLVNAELRADSTGWHARETRARFNDDPDPLLDKAIRRWTDTLRWIDADVAEEDPVAAEPPAPPVRGRPASSPLRDIGARLRELSRESFAQQHTAMAVLAAVAGDEDADPKSLTTLRRATPDELTRLCAEAFEARRVTLPALWSAAAARPMTAAVAALGPGARERYPRLLQLTADAPLASKTLRALVKDPDVAPSRSMDIVTIRLRHIIGRMAREADPHLARALIRDPRIEVLCPLILAVTCTAPPTTPTVPITVPRATTVPGFPTTALDDPDGPWQRAWPAATEIGFTPERFWNQVAETGALVPAAWLGAGGWIALWRSAAEHA